MDLLDAVDRLTKPVTHRLTVESHSHEWEEVREPSRWRRNEEGMWVVQLGEIVPGQWFCRFDDETTSNPKLQARVESVAVRTDPSPLEQLRLRIANSVGGAGGAGQQSKDRIPFDASAFDLYELIDGVVRAWLVDLGEPPAGGLEAGLRRWYRAFVRYPRDEFETGSKQAVLEGWWGRIRDVIDPPARREILAVCPVCGASAANAGPDECSPLWALFRETREDSEAVCLRCGTRWEGVDGMRALRIQIDESSVVAGEDDLQAAG